MDISTITDVNEIKALAYDQLVMKEQAQRNIDMLNNRLAELLNEPTPEAEPEVAKPKK